MNKLGINFGTGEAIPQNKDLTFITVLPGTKAGRFKLIGLWGDGFIELGRDPADTLLTSYNLSGTATDFDSQLGFVGLTHTFYVNENSRFLSSISWLYMETTTKFDSARYETNTFKRIYGSRQYETKLSATTEFKQKVDTKNNYSIGLIIDGCNINYVDSIFDKDYDLFRRVTDEEENITMLRSYAQWQHNFSNRLTCYAVHITSILV